MRYIGFLVIGICKMLVVFFLLPILLPLMVIDILMCIGGADPGNTPIRRLLDKFLMYHIY